MAAWGWGATREDHPPHLVKAIRSYEDLTPLSRSGACIGAPSRGHPNSRDMQIPDPRTGRSTLSGCSCGRRSTSEHPVRSVTEPMARTSAGMKELRDQHKYQLRSLSAANPDQLPTGTRPDLSPGERAELSLITNRPIEAVHHLQPIYTSQHSPLTPQSREVGALKAGHGARRALRPARVEPPHLALSLDYSDGSDGLGRFEVPRSPSTGVAAPGGTWRNTARRVRR